MRILVWTVAVTGTVLLSFGVMTGMALYQMKMASIDERLSSLANNRFPRYNDEWEWNRVINIIEDVGERTLGSQMGISVYDKSRKEIYVSDVLKGKLDLESFSEVEVVEESEIERPLGRGGRGRPEPFNMGEWSVGRRSGPPPLKGGERILDPLKFTKHTIKIDGTPWRVFVFQLPNANACVGVDLSGAMEDMNAARSAFLWALPIALALLAAGAWFFSSRAIRPLRKMTGVASLISAKNLSERIDAEREDKEFRALAEVFNSMLGRLEASFGQATRFSADAAHELKTPLAILQGHLEGLLQEAEDGSKNQRTLGMLLEETQRLTMITRKLLLLSKVDAGQLNLQLEPVDLVRMIEETIEDCEMQSLTIKFESKLPQDYLFSVDRTFFRQVLQNLLGNAVKYNLETDGVVSVKLVESEKAVNIDIFNTGSPIPQRMQSRLFERFVRGDEARNRSIDGIGLGLNLAQEFAKAHGATLQLVKSDDNGTLFRVTLPFQGR
ncbi:HAMP domain-containing histidine kinase [Puniceicoccaceae bacterium K14]|nr:HAMP domain-containing histidine kinase [Puniceicoccaceae bacterium K14]